MSSEEDSPLVSKPIAKAQSKANDKHEPSMRNMKDK